MVKMLGWTLDKDMDFLAERGRLTYDCRTNNSKTKPKSYLENAMNQAQQILESTRKIVSSVEKTLPPSKIKPSGSDWWKDQEFASPLEVLGMAMEDEGNKFEPFKESTYGKALLKCSKNQIKLGSIESEFTAKAHRECIVPMKWLILSNCDLQGNEEKLVFFHSQLEYCAKKHHYSPGQCISVPDNHEYLILKRDFEKQVKKVIDICESIIKSSDLLAGYLAKFAEAQAEYYERVGQHLNVIKCTENKSVIKEYLESLLKNLESESGPDSNRTRKASEPGSEMKRPQIVGDAKDGIEKIDQRPSKPVIQEKSANLHGQKSSIGVRRYSDSFLRGVAKEMKINILPIRHFQARNEPSFPTDGQIKGRASQFHAKSIIKPAPINYQEKPPIEFRKGKKPWNPELLKYKPIDFAGVELTNARLRKILTGCLNKITPENYIKLAVKMSTLDIGRPGHLECFRRLIFKKAIAEPGYSNLYAYVCMKMMMKYPDLFDWTVKDSIKNLDLYKGFGNSFRDDQVICEISMESNPDKRAMKIESYFFSIRSREKRFLNAIEFMAQLYLVKVLPIENILVFMNNCKVYDLEIEGLCNLLIGVGEYMVLNTGEILDQMEKILNALLALLIYSNEKNAKLVISQRIKFKIQYLVDLVNMKWLERAIHLYPIPRNAITLDII